MSASSGLEGCAQSLGRVFSGGVHFLDRARSAAKGCADSLPVPALADPACACAGCQQQAAAALDNISWGSNAHKGGDGAARHHRIPARVAASSDVLQRPGRLLLAACTCARRVSHSRHRQCTGAPFCGGSCSVQEAHAPTEHAPKGLGAPFET